METPTAPARRLSRWISRPSSRTCRGRTSTTAHPWTPPEPPSRFLPLLAQYWQSWKDTGHAPAHTVFVPGGYTTVVGQGLATPRQGSMHLGFRQTFRFSADPAAGQWEFSAAGSVPMICGAIVDKVTSTAVNGKGLMQQNPDERNYGIPLAPGVYKQTHALPRPRDLRPTGSDWARCNGRRQLRLEPPRHPRQPGGRGFPDKRRRPRRRHRPARTSLRELRKNEAGDDLRRAVREGRRRRVRRIPQRPQKRAVPRPCQKPGSPHRRHNTKPGIALRTDRERRYTLRAELEAQSPTPVVRKRKQRPDQGARLEPQRDSSSRFTTALLPAMIEIRDTLRSWSLPILPGRGAGHEVPCWVRSADLRDLATGLSPSRGNLRSGPGWGGSCRRDHSPPVELA